MLEKIPGWDLGKCFNLGYMHCEKNAIESIAFLPKTCILLTQQNIL